MGKKKSQAAALMPLIVLCVLAVGGAVTGVVLLVRQSRQPQQTIDQSTLNLETAALTTTSEAITTSVTDYTTTLSGTTGTVDALYTTTMPGETLATTTTAGAITKIELTFYKLTMTVGDKAQMPIVTMYPADAKDKSEVWSTSDPKVAVVDWQGNITPVGAGTCIVTVKAKANLAVKAEVEVTVKAKTTTAAATTAATTTTAAATTTTAAATTATAAATTSAAGTTTTATETTKQTPQRSDIEVIDGITYVQGILIVNKTYSLPSTYNPGVQPEAQAAFNKMAQAAAQEGLKLTSVSDFRSYATQQTLYNNYCNRDGKAEADRYSARPGHSEHQTGLAFDINYAGSAFTNTPEAKWVAENCWKYGFILRYPEGKEDVTGFMYESWHVRYLGEEWAKKIFDSGKTLEEYLDIDSVYAD